ncbi:hypothetical protein GCM10010416_23240 [Streptomyces caniferus]
MASCTGTAAASASACRPNLSIAQADGVTGSSLDTDMQRPPPPDHPASQLCDTYTKHTQGSDPAMTWAQAPSSEQPQLITDGRDVRPFTGSPL